MNEDSLSRLDVLASQCREHLHVIVREKDLDAKDLHTFTQQIVDVTAHHGSQVLVNSRADVAMSMTPRLGLHLPENGLPIELARRVMGKNTIIGRSVHDQAGAEEAVKAGADYILVAPVFEVPGKGPGMGIAGLIETVDNIPIDIPVIALGGISSKNVSQLKGFVDGIAAIRGIWRNDLAPTLENLLDVSPPVPT